MVTRHLPGVITVQLALPPMCMHALCMATKTISVDLEAYEILRRARQTAKESFSQVIKRGRWKRSPKTCGDILASSAEIPAAPASVLKKLEVAQSSDAPPDSAWDE